MAGVVHRLAAAACAAALGVLHAVSAAFAHELPLGDGKISSEPKAGFVFSCQQRFDPGFGGAHAAGAWLKDGTYDPDLKPVVDGSVAWPSHVEITLKGDRRIIWTNRLPSHPTGVFPISPQDDAYAHDRNPHAIREGRVLLDLPAEPRLADAPSCLPMGLVGVMLSGAALFHALDGVGRDAPAHEILDGCDGHPERTGEYHYHDHSPCMADDGVAQPGGHGRLLGFALDGFGIFGPQGEDGVAQTNAGLDACHGHSHEIIWNGKPARIYHYHFTAEYPYSIGCFAGMPVR
jgi:hypothetical protein